MPHSYWRCGGWRGLNANPRPSALLKSSTRCDPGLVCAVELKAKGGKLSEAQAAVKRHLEQAGHGYLVSSDYREVIETLKGWGVVKACISVQ